ncbi:MAG TPA: DNA-binding response regulator, partial [Cytophagales bacterium]|nr:DNA-binding response regulator [Cytophagales bacterium]
RQIPGLELLAEFRSGLAAMEYLRVHPVDFIFLDINMPDLSGLDLLRSLPLPPLVIFTTAYAEYAVESYEFDAVDYLLKPIALPKLVQAVEKVRQRLTSPTPLTAGSAPESQIAVIRDGPETHRIPVSDLLYLEASGNHTYYHTRRRKLICTTSLTDALASLPASPFRRIHRSFAIQVAHLQKVERHQVTVAGVALPLGKTYREAFLAEFL